MSIQKKCVLHELNGVIKMVLQEETMHTNACSYIKATSRRVLENAFSWRKDAYKCVFVYKNHVQMRTFECVSTELFPFLFRINTFKRVLINTFKV